MPWCPVCRSEYRDEFKVCADCGAPLVLSYEDIDKISEDPNSHDNIKDLVEFEENEIITNIDINSTYAEIMDGNGDVFDEENGPCDDEITGLASSKKNVYKPYVKASERAENYKSSAYALLLVGSVGIIFLFLSLLGVIPIKIAENIRVVGFIAMLIMFLAFIIVGIKSLIEAKTINALSDTEDALTDSITDYFKENYSIDKIDEKALLSDNLNMSDEEKFFKREEVIRNLIITKFGDLESSYLDNETERIYDLIYGK